jgi:hypothetical protein
MASHPRGRDRLMSHFRLNAVSGTHAETRFGVPHEWHVDIGKSLRAIRRIDRPKYWRDANLTIGSFDGAFGR